MRLADIPDDDVLGSAIGGLGFDSLVALRKIHRAGGPLAVDEIDVGDGGPLNDPEWVREESKRQKREHVIGELARYGYVVVSHPRRERLRPIDKVRAMTGARAGAAPASMTVELAADWRDRVLRNMSDGELQRLYRNQVRAR